MQELRRNVQRTYWATVNVEDFDADGKPQKGSFKAQFVIHPRSVLNERSEEALLDVVLKDVKHIVMVDLDGNDLSGQELLEACKNDVVIATAIQAAYHKTIVKNFPSQT